ncbi:MAG: SDR family oxidoreductase [Ileibacterium sp.]|nr:SDR family oxidoreductase [Ileibacterium sp.]
MNRLNDKVAIITGGNSGVGAATAKLFADEGAKVVVSARRKDKLDEVAREIEENGGEVLAVACDISKPEDAVHLIEETMKEYGQIDILVNNAGIMEEGLKPIGQAEDEDIEQILNTNLKGTLFMCRAAVREMEDSRCGSIVNVASVAGQNGCGPAVYTSSKAGVIGLTKHIAVRYAKSGIRANAVCPGNIESPTAMIGDPEKMDKHMLEAVSSHMDLDADHCSPEDVANIILFLASDESQALTGQILVSDYGSSL